ncbi:MAG TPA: helix-turn-helix domain-containing protein [Xanthobacteraceae bacterium]|jgi:AraC family transcriptional activator of pobA|nr:helix-turn-helix domain-containing protein [Xanthobacteraceae bacterium]
MTSTSSLPLFHLYGDPPDDQAFDFIHIETITSRSSIHDWTIRAHRHRNLFQILLIECGGGEMIFEANKITFAAPCVVLIPPTVAHGFRFLPEITEGWVASFTEDVASALGDQSGVALARLKAMADDPLIPLQTISDGRRLSALCADIHEERFLAREGYRLAMRSLLTLIAIEAVRLAASRARSGMVTLQAADATVEALRRLVEDQFRRERQIKFYADLLAMTPDRLNDHVKRATGVTAGHLIRQRVLTEAKRQLVFTTVPVNEIAYDLAFSDPSHFTRFFRKHTGVTPQAFRASALREGEVAEAEPQISDTKPSL